MSLRRKIEMNKFIVMQLAGAIGKRRDIMPYLLSGRGNSIHLYNIWEGNVQFTLTELAISVIEFRGKPWLPQLRWI